MCGRENALKMDRSRCLFYEPIKVMDVSGHSLVNGVCSRVFIFGFLLSQSLKDTLSDEEITVPGCHVPL